MTGNLGLLRYFWDRQAVCWVSAHSVSFKNELKAMKNMLYFLSRILVVGFFFLKLFWAALARGNGDNCHYHMKARPLPPGQKPQVYGSKRQLEDFSNMWAFNRQTQNNCRSFVPDHLEASFSCLPVRIKHLCLTFLVTGILHSLI